MKIKEFTREAVMIDSGSIKQLAGHPIDRRDFLKVLGWSGAAVALSGCGNTSVEDGKETVVSYVEANDYMIPGEIGRASCRERV